MEQVIDLYLPPEATVKLDIKGILDEEKLLRLHPHWFVEELEPQDTYIQASLRDYDTENEFALGLRLDCSSPPENSADCEVVFSIQLFQYGVKEIVFYVDGGSTTRVRISYVDDTPQQQLVDDVLLWVRGIQEYLRLYISATPRTLFFRVLMNRMVLQMNPSQRKICLMIARFTVVEIVVILAIVLGYVIFGQ